MKFIYSQPLKMGMGENFHLAPSPLNSPDWQKCLYTLWSHAWLTFHPKSKVCGKKLCFCAYYAGHWMTFTILVQCHSQAISLKTNSWNRVIYCFNSQPSIQYTVDRKSFAIKIFHRQSFWWKLDTQNILLTYIDLYQSWSLKSSDAI